MPPRSRIVRGYMTPFAWVAQGNYSAYPTDVTSPPAANGGPGSWGCIVYMPVNLCISEIRMLRRVAGSSGTTTAQLWRLRGGVWTLLAALSVTAASGDMQSSAATPAPPDNLLELGDLAMVRFTAVEAGTPLDVRVSLETR